MKNKELIVETLKSTAPGLATTGFVLIAIVLFSPPPAVLLAGFLTLTLARALWGALKQDFEVASDWGTKLLKSSAVLTLFILFLWSLTHYTGRWGYLGLLVIVLAISAKILTSKWSEYIEWLRTIERTIWGATMEERRERRK